MAFLGRGLDKSYSSKGEVKIGSKERVRQD